MRKLVSKEETAKKQRRNQIIVGIILGVVLVLSVMGFALQGAIGNTSSSSGQGTLNYNGFQFTTQNNLWILGNFVFQNSPGNVSNLSSAIVGTLNSAQTYQNVPAYIYSENDGAKVEAYANIGNIAERVQDACPSDVNCTENVPVKNCTSNFIIIKPGNTSMIKQDGGCVYIEGQSQDLVKLTDEFLYKILGVN